MLEGWDPGSRRTIHACLECDGSWCVVDNPGELVDALAAYSRARRDGNEQLRAGVDGRLRALSLTVPA